MIVINQSYSFSKYEKLKKKKDIEALFKQGKWITFNSLRIVYLVQPNEHSLKFPLSLITVNAGPKKFHNAVSRNYLKRVLRECIRLSKHNLQPILAAKNIRLCAMVIYSNSTTLPFNEIQLQYNQLFENLLVALQK